MNYEQKHPILQKLEEYFKNTPKEQIDKDWSNILKDTDSEAYYKKKYNDALERARYYHSKDYMLINNAIENIFPELKEREDEKIKKAIHIYLDWLDGRKDYAPKGNYTIRDMIAWLEKQGEQPTDKVEPKFHPGDWIVDDETPNDVFCVIEVLEEIYKVIDIDGDDYHIPHCKADKQFHLWTIEDAEDGDVLSSEDKDKVFLYNGKFDLRGRVCAYCGIYKTYDGLRFTECAIGNYFTYKEPYPATKEQRDLLFQKMKDAGYEWNSEKKQLSILNLGC